MNDLQCFALLKNNKQTQAQCVVTIGRKSWQRWRSPCFDARVSVYLAWKRPLLETAMGQQRQPWASLTWLVRSTWEPDAGGSLPVLDAMDSRMECRLRPAGKIHGGERGIRTPDTVPRIRAFEARGFSHSPISPRHGCGSGARNPLIEM